MLFPASGSNQTITPAVELLEEKNNFLFDVLAF